MFYAPAALWLFRRSLASRNFQQGKRECWERLFFFVVWIELFAAVALIFIVLLIGSRCSFVFVLHIRVIICRLHIILLLHVLPCNALIFCWKRFRRSMERNKFSSARITAERLNYIYPLPWYVNTRTARYCAVKIKYGRESKPRLRFFVWCCIRPAPKRRLSSRFAA